MPRYRINVGYMAPKYATVEIEAADEQAAQNKALDWFANNVHDEMQIDDEGGTSNQVFDCWELDVSA